MSAYRDSLQRIWARPTYFGIFICALFGHVCKHEFEGMWRCTCGRRVRQWREVPIWEKHTD